MLGLGQRPAARGQAGPDPGHVGVARLVVGDRGDGLTDRLGRFWLALMFVEMSLDAYARDVAGNGFPEPRQSGERKQLQPLRHQRWGA
jgi:hypothetical protein